jgi:mannose-1-phosphate guanylyltransferase
MDNTYAMILAAGLGTRLRPLTDELPKPALPVCNQPMIGFALGHLAGAGLPGVVVNTHHLGDRLKHVCAGTGHSVGIAWSDESSLLGTAGGLRRAWEVRAWGAVQQPREAVVIVTNADTLFTPDVADLVRAFRAADAEWMLVARPNPDPRAYARLECSPDRTLRSIEWGSSRAGGLMYTGMSLLRMSLLESLPAAGCLIRDGVLPRLARGFGVDVYDVGHDEPWHDVGTVHAYWDLQVRATREPERLSAWPELNLTEAMRQSESVWHPTSVLTVPSSALHRVIVWPQARVDAPLRNAIVTPSRIVRVTEAHDADGASDAATRSQPSGRAPR